MMKHFFRIILFLMILVSCEKVIIQEPYLTLAKTELSVPYDGSTERITFRSSSKPYFSCWQSWTACSVSFADEKGSISVSVGENKSKEARTTKIAFTVEDIKIYLIVNQDGRPDSKPDNDKPENPKDDGNDEENNDGGKGDEGKEDDASQEEPEQPKEPEEGEDDGNDDITPVPDAFTLSLPANGEFKVYTLEPIEIPFNILENSTEEFRYSSSTVWTDLTVEFAEDGQSGIIYLTPKAENASGDITFTNGVLEVTYSFVIEQYYLDAETNSLSVPAEGGEYTLKFTSNLPSETLSLSCTSYDIAAGLNTSEGEIKLEISRNETSQSRQFEITLSETSRNLTPLIWTITQEPGNAKVEGCVWFEDLKLKSAVVSLYDNNGDKEISYEEADLIQQLNVANLGITSMTGVEHMHNLRSIDFSGNSIAPDHVVDFSGDHMYLAEITCDNNIDIDVSGARTVIDFRSPNNSRVNLDQLYAFRYQDPNNCSARKRTDTPDSRTSTDFSRHLEEKILQTHTKGKGISIVFVIDGLLDIDITTGVYDYYINKAYKTLFCIEPMKSLKEYFDVKFKYAVSAERIKPYDPNVPTPNTAFGITGMPDNYIKGNPLGFTSNKIVYDLIESDEKLVFLALGEGRAIAEPSQNYEYCFMECHDNDLETTLQHELVGHIIGHLNDEYIEFNEQVPSWHPGTYLKERNTTKKTDPKEVPWARLLEHPSYKDITGIYEGAFYRYGIYKSTLTSLMGGADKFNAISRYYIYETVFLRSYIKPDGTRLTEDEKWELFFEYDKINL